MTANARAAVSVDSVHRIEQSSGALATQAVTQMDRRLPWFGELPAEQRSWVTLVAQAGVAALVEWLRAPAGAGADVSALAGQVFGAAPTELTRAVTLRQTVEMVRVMIGVVEEQVPTLAGPEQADAVEISILTFAREIAFAAARVYAGAAESRGAWDSRLEALVIDELVRGVDTAPSSQAAALGWRHAGPVLAVVGHARSGDAAATLSEVHLAAGRAGYDCLAGVHAGRLVTVLGGARDGEDGTSGTRFGPHAAHAIMHAFAPGPVVVSAVAPDIGEAGPATQDALGALGAAEAWPGAPRPVAAEQLLPERAIAGDRRARAHLIEEVFTPLAANAALLATMSAFVEAGTGLEATARALFVHPNTVRYRLRRVTEVCGHSPTDARGLYALQVAMTLGRLSDPGV